MTDPGHPWPPGMRIRPTAALEDGRVEAVDVVSGRRFEWDADALARYVAADGDPSGLPDPVVRAWEDGLRASRTGHDDVRAGLRRWWRHRWHPSDQLYLASRRVPFIDADDDSGQVRTRALEAFLAEDGPPRRQPPDGPRIALGAPAQPPEESISALLVARRTIRTYKRAPVQLDVLSGLLWHGLEDVRALRERESPDEPLSYLQSYGSGWAFYLCVYDVAGLDPGSYHYDVTGHQLVQVRPGDHREAMVTVLQGMRSPKTAAFTFGLVADFPVYQWRYRHDHALRRLYTEAGVIAQSLIVLGHGHGLGALVTPAQKDSEYLQLHGLDPDRYAPVYTITMGLRRDDKASRQADLDEFAAAEGG